MYRNSHPQYRLLLTLRKGSLPHFEPWPLSGGCSILHKIKPLRTSPQTSTSFLLLLDGYSAHSAVFAVNQAHQRTDATIPHFFQVTMYIPHLRTFRNFFDPTVCNFTQPTSLLHLVYGLQPSPPSPCRHCVCTCPSTARSTAQPTECLPNSPRANPLRRE